MALTNHDGGLRFTPDTDEELMQDGPAVLSINAIRTGDDISLLVQLGFANKHLTPDQALRVRDYLIEHLGLPAEAAAAVRGAREASAIMDKYQARSKDLLKGIDQVVEAEIARGHTLYEAQYRALLDAQRAYDTSSLEWAWFEPRVVGARNRLRAYEAEVLASSNEPLTDL